MAVQTETTLDVLVNLTKVDEIGISDTLDSYTDADIAAFLYVGAKSRMLGGNIDIYTDSAGSYDTWNAGMPYNTGAVTSNTMIMVNGDGQYDSPAEGRYLGVVLLYPTDDQYNQFDIYITVSNSFKYAIVTEITPNKYLLDITSNLYQVDGTGATVWTDTTNTLYDPQIVDTAIKYKDGDTYKAVSINNIEPYFVVEYGGYLYLIRAVNVNQTAQFKCSFAQSPPWNAGTVYYPLSYNDVSASISVAFNGYGFGTHISDIDPSDTDFTWYYSFTDPKYSLSDNVLMYADFNSYKITCSYYYINYHDTMMMYANSGLYFRINSLTVFKPLIDNNVVYDFTDDLTEASDIDNYSGSTKHDIPVTPPTPPTPPGPYDDDPWNGVSFSGVGVGGAGAFAKCYYMTSTELANLRSWMNSNNVPEGFDPMAQIIGLSQVPVSLSGDDNSTVQFVNSSAVYDPGVTRLVDSGVSTQIAMGTPIRYSLGSVDITRRMQERGEPYLDYDCQIELYLPLIGMFSLDTQAVMGRTITAEAVLDPISGTLAAYAYVSRDGQNLPIAYGSTTIGVDLPISAQQYSVSRAALKQANAQLGASILSSTLSFIAAATAGGKGSGTGAKTATGTTNGLAAAGIREAGADYMKASQAGNVFGDFMQWGRTIRQLSYGNNTAIAGSFGGSTAQWSYPFTPYVKIIRPRYEKPSNYAHSQGVPCVQTKSVGSCTGFIQCIGVDVSGITGATDIELQAIQSALANGVFAGGGA